MSTVFHNFLIDGWKKCSKTLTFLQKIRSKNVKNTNNLE